jgi:hypothetical protein
MHHKIWHTLLHLGAHLGSHLAKHLGSGPACAKCGSTDDLKSRNCCGVILCESHAAQWRRLVTENGYRCVICDKPCVFNS